MTKVIVIKACKECPYFKMPAWDDQKSYLCGHKKLMNTKLPNPHGIHDYCPLDEQ